MIYRQGSKTKRNCIFRLSGLYKKPYFDKLGKKETASVTTLAVFDELAAEAATGLLK
jgi:hypothetical protein